MPDITPQYITAEWPAPANIRAVSTTRLGGYSLPPYDSLNLGKSVGDEPDTVMRNRKLLYDSLKLTHEPLWVKQVHKSDIICADSPNSTQATIEADGVYATERGRVCLIGTADCLPILLTNQAGNIVAALHGGWRGLAAGIIEKGVAICQQSGSPILAWLGPGIAQADYEVGDEVRDAFIKQNPQTSACFIPSPNGRWLADLYGIAKQRLLDCSVTAIYGGEFNTYQQIDRFYSFRREKTTGRMASLIWME